MLARLGAEMAAAAMPLRADCKRAERAAYLARLGRFDEALSAIQEVQQRYDRTPQIEVSIWLNIAQGLFDYFNNVGISKNDRLQRAYALSSASGHDALRALCAAWLAQWSYVRFDAEALAGYVREAFELSSPEHHSARSRASLVAAQALHLAGRSDLAKTWYLRAREHAAAESDDTTISALMHNMAWLRMLAMRHAVLSKTGQANAGAYALINAESMAHFDDMIGDSTWQDLKPILRAQIVSLQGDSAQALALYDKHLASETLSRLQGNLLADKAWCLADTGRVSDALEFAQLSTARLDAEMQVDDRAAAHSRLAQVFGCAGDASNEKVQQALAEAAWQDFEALQARLVRLLDNLEVAAQP